MNATLGIAGVNTRPLHAATVGIAGNWGSGLRPHIQQLPTAPKVAAGARLGDQAANACWRHASYLLDYTYLLLVEVIVVLRTKSVFACHSQTIRSDQGSYAEDLSE